MTLTGYECITGDEGIKDLEQWLHNYKGKSTVHIFNKIQQQKSQHLKITKPLQSQYSNICNRKMCVT